MHIILEYTVCVGLVFVAGALLFGACAAFLIIQEVAGLFAGFVDALMRRHLLVGRSIDSLKRHAGSAME